jgi:Rhomboid-like protein
VGVRDRVPAAVVPAAGRRWDEHRLTAGLARFCRGRDLAIGYSLVVVVSTVVLALVPRSVHDEFLQQSSTNLYNLRHHPIEVLVVSAFVLGSPGELAEIPLLVWGYGAVQRWLGRAATVVTGVFGHVGATLFVAVLLAAGITHGLVSASVGFAQDVGVSYGLAAVAGLCAIRVPRRWRTAYLSVLVATLAVALLLVPTFTSVGHAVAFGIGASLAVLVAAGVRSTVDTVSHRDDRHRGVPHREAAADRVDGGADAR